MGWFGRRRLAKIARIIAFVTALSTACANKEERFVELVNRSDRAVAMEIIKNPQKKADLNNVKKALYNLKNIVKLVKRNVK